MWLGSAEPQGGCQHSLQKPTSVSCKQCLRPGWKWCNGRWSGQPLVGRGKNHSWPRLHHKIGQLYKADRWMSDQEHGTRKPPVQLQLVHKKISGVRLVLVFIFFVQRDWHSNRFIEREWPMGDLDWWWAGQHSRKQTCCPAQLHLWQAWSNPISQVWSA